MDINKLSLIFEKFGNIMSAHARVQGMIADNDYRKMRGGHIAYSFNDFETQVLKIDEASLFLLNLSTDPPKAECGA